MMKSHPFFRRVLIATLLCMGGCSVTLQAQQRLRFRLDAPQGIDANTLRTDVGKLMITFSNSPDFQKLSNYAARCLDLGGDYKSSKDDTSHKYYSCELTLNSGGDGGTAWWGNANPTRFDLNMLRRWAGVASGNPLYYRVYSPHFNRIIIGQIAPTAEASVIVHHTELAAARRITYQPVTGRDGNMVPAKLAPDLRVGAYVNNGLFFNVQNLTEAFALYALEGDTLRYLVAPESRELALHADSLVVTDTTTCVTTDYRQATLCRFYITDSKGNLCPVVNGNLSSVYYPQRPVGKGNFYGFGYGFYNFGGNQLTALTAPDGAPSAYVLPGTQNFQFNYPHVETDDEDFLMPYNCDGRYILNQVTVPASEEPVSLSVGRSTPLHVITTLAGAAPYAKNLKLDAITYVSRPYAWGDNSSVAIENREISRQIKGNDLVITTLVEGSTPKATLQLTARYGAQSDTLTACFNSTCLINDKDRDPEVGEGSVYHFTQEHFCLDDNRDGHPNFSILHPVKFVIPCHLMQTGHELAISGSYASGSMSEAGHPFDVTASHHSACAKVLAVDSEAPVPYDTLTFILPEGTYTWHMQNGQKEYDSASLHRFTLAATDDLVQTIDDKEFTLLRVVDLGADSIYVYNGAPASHVFHRNSVEKYTSNICYASESIPLHPGYNEHTVAYRQIKIEKDTVHGLRCGLLTPCIYSDEEGVYHDGYTTFDAGDLKYVLGRDNTISPDSAILVSTGSEVDLAMSRGGRFFPAFFVRVKPSCADTVLTAYTQKRLNVEFTYNGVSLNKAAEEVGLLQLNMFLGQERTRVVPDGGFLSRGLQYLVSGSYTLSGVLSLDGETRNFGTSFIVEEDKPVTVELNDPTFTAIPTAPIVHATNEVQARYTIDGRRIAVPQRGVNILRMADGSVRKVMVE